MGTQQTIAIIGGGVTGALTAYHLVRLSTPARIVIIEPRAELGLGLAYSTTSAQHLLNVPAGKISALPEEPNHFLQWVRAHYDANATAADFIPRLIFGKYIQSLLAKAPGIEHLRTTAIDCQMEADVARLTLGDGTQLLADAVVLATGNFDPAPFPRISKQIEENGAYRHSAWCEEAYANLPSDAPVTLIGTGLTAVDVLLKLRESGHRGIVTAISRHGVFPNRQEHYTPLTEPALNGEPPTTARALLHQVRQAIKRPRLLARRHRQPPRPHQRTLACSSTPLNRSASAAICCAAGKSFDTAWPLPSPTVSTQNWLREPSSKNKVT